MESSYKDFGYTGTEPLSASPYVWPRVFELLPADGKILDVGCGNGALIGELLARDYQATGTDLSEEGIAIARAAYPAARFELAGAAEIDKLGERFDAVISVEVIEHLYDPEGFAAACYRVLNPGGRLLVSTPYHGPLKNLALAIAGKWDAHHEPHKVGGHIKFFSRRSLTALLLATGFCEVGFSGVGRLPFLWKSMLLTARRP